ncbi:hypothetical protein [Shewanella livingstonensis]|uniref:Uncharacterized protein n=1 Tax=Shewanella livingstonensis TaxID=150120 RepID=A0A3G8LU52_9GAMM|nr:hypothetical protein [Shewanella livingstonensis]AZG73017.1 hypothetical protein EGC82_09725 [Shewanella livingstonensis]
MEGIFCSYYDEEIDQDVPLQPDLAEAISFFKGFIWENQNEESTMKMLILQATGSDEASLFISSLNKGKWEIGATASTRRRFLGPFFKRVTSESFIDNTERETLEFISFFYQKTLADFIALLEKNGH